MNHLTQEEFVLIYYGEPELGAERRAHLAQCAECTAELAALAAVLDRVTPVEVPDPGDDYEARTWSRMQWRLRGEKKRERFATWVKSAAIAATVMIAFLAGMFWKSSPEVDTPSRQVVESTTNAAQPASTTPEASSTRVLLVVVGEHFDQSERILVELTNITPKGNNDISAERERAEDLLASNRLYRRTALNNGEEDVAALLDELEPMLLQIAHSPAQVSAEELRAMQKRVETKGLVFKLRVVRADVNRNAATQTSI
ncbi:MAG TPA: hypothetical protein VF064_05085 [Pyrinomonadaceae bacterium]